MTPDTRGKKASGKSANKVNGDTLGFEAKMWEAADKLRSVMDTAVIKRLKAAGIQGSFMTWKQVSGLMKSVTNSLVTINAMLTTVGFAIAAVMIFIIIFTGVIGPLAYLTYARRP